MIEENAGEYPWRPLVLDQQSRTQYRIWIVRNLGTFVALDNLLPWDSVQTGFRDAVGTLIVGIGAADWDSLHALNPAQTRASYLL